MIVNHRAMVQVLRAFTLMDQYSVYDGTRVVECGSRKVAADEVLDYFGWTKHSFHHKCKWFGNTLDVVKEKRWRGNSPDICKISVYSLSSSVIF